jgi:indole-3-glycerol phosphate synthase/phosphoribosylanthranilate isomerase
VSSILQEIVARKRIDVAERKRRISVNEMCERTSPTTRSLSAALRRSGLRFILECKKASPSEGLIRDDYEPAAIAQIYAPFADAISVLTDTPYFAGDFSHLKQVRASVDLPVLCKDFVVEPYQIVEARDAGADAVLLMLSVLDDAAYHHCAAEAARWGMDVLTEVHHEAELDRALALGAPIIGINNRDLNTLKVDLGTTRRLAPKIPSDRIVVCESGLTTRGALDAVADWVDGYLVGSHLMKSNRLDLAVRDLIFGPVKICGLTSREQVHLAYAAGASWGGLVFALESPRFVSDEQARAIAVDSPLRLAGVFVNETVPRMAQLVSTLHLAAVQLHGDESSATIAALRRVLPANCEIWKAVRVADKIPSDVEFGADRLLLDAYAKGARGGSGTSFDWSLLGDRVDKNRMILAGGIGPENVAAAQRIGCSMLDVNSCVESAPGVKDETKLRRLFAALRGE